MTPELEAERARKAAYRLVARLLEQALAGERLQVASAWSLDDVRAELQRIQEAMEAAGAVPTLQINQPEGDA